jgi:hypothetical protein
MPTPTPMPLRDQMPRLRQQGLTLAAIAARVQTPERTVRRLLRRAAGSAAALAPRDDRAPHRRSPLPEDLRRLALDRARRHPGWGATSLRPRLAESHPDAPGPAPRTLRRWLAAARPGPAPAGRKPRGPSPRAAAPQDTWPMDATDQVRLATGRPVCGLRITDEGSGAFLLTQAFSPGPLQPGAARRRAGPGAAVLRPLGAAAGRPGR